MGMEFAGPARRGVADHSFHVSVAPALSSRPRTSSAAISNASSPPTHTPSRSSAAPINIRKNIKSSALIVKIAAGGYHNLVSESPERLHSSVHVTHAPGCRCCSATAQCGRGEVTTMVNSASASRARSPQMLAKAAPTFALHSATQFLRRYLVLNLAQAPADAAGPKPFRPSNPRTSMCVLLHCPFFLFCFGC